jgi:hypothetical protein
MFAGKAYRGALVRCSTLVGSDLTGKD